MPITKVARSRATLSSFGCFIFCRNGMSCETFPPGENLFQV
jgi:hypothetical protein